MVLARTGQVMLVSGKQFLGSTCPKYSKKSISSPGINAKEWPVHGKIKNVSLHEYVT